MGFFFIISIKLRFFYHLLLVNQDINQISYGYQWMISPQWNMEAGISLGYAHLNYKRYGQPAGAPLIEKSNCNYWGLTQIGISVVYFIQ